MLVYMWQCYSQHWDKNANELRLVVGEIAEEEKTQKFGCKFDRDCYESGAKTITVYIYISSWY